MMTQAVLMIALLAGASPDVLEGKIESAAAVDSIDREFRLYRISVYQAYRTNRPVYDRHRELGDELYSRWQSVGSPAESAEQLEKWYRDATSATQAKMATPELPSIASQVAQVSPAETLSDVYFQEHEQSEVQGVQPLEDVALDSLTLPEETDVPENPVETVESPELPVEHDSLDKSSAEKRPAKLPESWKQIGGAFWRAVSE